MPRFLDLYDEDAAPQQITQAKPRAPAGDAGLSQLLGPAGAGQGIGDGGGEEEGGPDWLGFVGSLLLGPEFAEGRRKGRQLQAARSADARDFAEDKRRYGIERKRAEEESAARIAESTQRALSSEAATALAKKEFEHRKGQDLFDRGLAKTKDNREAVKSVTNWVTTVATLNDAKKRLEMATTKSASDKAQAEVDLEATNEQIAASKARTAHDAAVLRLQEEASEASIRGDNAKADKFNEEIRMLRIDRATAAGEKYFSNWEQIGIDVSRASLQTNAQGQTTGFIAEPGFVGGVADMDPERRMMLYDALSEGMATHPDMKNLSPDDRKGIIQSLARRIGIRVDAKGKVTIVGQEELKDLTGPGGALAKRMADEKQMFSMESVKTPTAKQANAEGMAFIEDYLSGKVDDDGMLQAIAGADLESGAKPWRQIAAPVPKMDLPEGVTEFAKDWLVPGARGLWDMLGPNVPPKDRLKSLRKQVIKRGGNPNDPSEYAREMIRIRNPSGTTNWAPPELKAKGKGKPPGPDQLQQTIEEVKRGGAAGPRTPSPGYPGGSGPRGGTFQDTVEEVKAEYKERMGREAASAAARKAWPPPGYPGGSGPREGHAFQDILEEVEAERAASTQAIQAEGHGGPTAELWPGRRDHLQQLIEKIKGELNERMAAPPVDVLQQIIEEIKRERAQPARRSPARVK